MSRIGSPSAPVKVLVVGAIHGNESAGHGRDARLLRRRPADVAGVEFWVIPTVNPDGVAAGTRQNARGVDLNRNFPAGWRAQGRARRHVPLGAAPAVGARVPPRRPPRARACARP